jgi:type IV pilus assembly protein PilC
LEDDSRLQNQIKSAMSYPVTVGSIAVIVFVCMTVFLIPTFAEIFADIGTELPAFTLAMLAISKFLRTPAYSVTLVIALIGAWIVYQQYYKTPAGQLMMDGIFLKLPIF